METLRAKGPDTFQCATLKMPLDYSDPGGKTIGLAISRLTAGSTKNVAAFCCSTRAAPAHRDCICLPTRS